ncbi:MAG: carbon starvation CstA family protein, partial [Thermodesulfobacteriota bacterium]
MSGILLILGSGVLLVVAYVFYGAYLSRRLDIDPSRQTPAHQEQDGVD